MFWLGTARRLLWPMPPMPTAAMLSRSLGGVKPRPSTWRGTMSRAAPVMAALSMNCRRDTPSVLISSMTPPLRVGHDIPSPHVATHSAGMVCNRFRRPGGGPVFAAAGRGRGAGLDRCRRPAGHAELQLPRPHYRPDDPQHGGHRADLLRTLAGARRAE